MPCNRIPRGSSGVALIVSMKAAGLGRISRENASMRRCNDGEKAIYQSDLIRVDAHLIRVDADRMTEAE
jgi:hypothetical protein